MPKMVLHYLKDPSKMESSGEEKGHNSMTTERRNTKETLLKANGMAPVFHSLRMELSIQRVNSQMVA